MHLETAVRRLLSLSPALQLVSRARRLGKASAMTVTALALVGVACSSGSGGGAGGSSGSGGSSRQGGSSASGGSGGVGGSGGGSSGSGGSGASGAAGSGGSGASGASGASGGSGSGGSGSSAVDAREADTSGGDDAALGDDAGDDAESTDTATPADAPVASGPFALTSDAFKEGGNIDNMYRCPPNANISPELSWTPGPAGTKSYGITLAHGTAVHWQMWDIPATTLGLPKDVMKVAEPAVPAGAKQSKPATAGATWYGYTGPCPTSTATSVYDYVVYAFKTEHITEITPDSPYKDVTAAFAKYTLKMVKLSGTGHQ